MATLKALKFSFFELKSQLEYIIDIYNYKKGEREETDKRDEIKLPAVMCFSRIKTHHSNSSNFCKTVIAVSSIVSNYGKKMPLS